MARVPENSLICRTADEDHLYRVRGCTVIEVGIFPADSVMTWCLENHITPDYSPVARAFRLAPGDENAAFLIRMRWH